MAEIEKCKTKNYIVTFDSFYSDVKEIQQYALFELFNLYGRRVAAVSLYHYFKSRLLDVSKLSEGVYAYSIKNKNEVLQSGKVAVVK